MQYILIIVRLFLRLEVEAFNMLTCFDTNESIYHEKVCQSLFVIFSTLYYEFMDKECYQVQHIDNYL